MKKTKYIYVFVLIFMLLVLVCLSIFEYYSVKEMKELYAEREGNTSQSMQKTEEENDNG